MANSLLHFEKGVPISDLQLRNDQKRRLARVDHVYWQWLKNPFSVDYRALFRQLVKGKFSDPASETHAAQKDIQLFEYIKDTVSPLSRNEARLKVKFAAEKAIQIGNETDNVQALTKGGDLLYKVAGLDKPEDNSTDINKVSFLPSVVVTNVQEVDKDRVNIDDEESKRIAAKYGAYVDEKRGLVDKQVAMMEARSGITTPTGDEGKEEGKEADDEQGRD